MLIFYFAFSLRTSRTWFLKKRLKFFIILVEFTLWLLILIRVNSVADLIDDQHGSESDENCGSDHCCCFVADDFIFMRMYVAFWHCVFMVMVMFMLVWIQLGELMLCIN